MCWCCNRLFHQSFHRSRFELEKSEGAQVNSRSIIYMSLILIGCLLSESLPYFQILGLTPFSFFCALFLPYFGLKTYLLVLSYWCFHLFRFFPSLYRLSDAMIESVTMTLAPTFPNFAKVVLPPVAIIYFLLMNIILVKYTSRALDKIGVYKRIYI